MSENGLKDSPRSLLKVGGFFFFAIYTYIHRALYQIIKGGITFYGAEAHDVLVESIKNVCVVVPSVHHG